MRLTLSDREVGNIISALRVAAEAYLQDAAKFHTQGEAPNERLFEQFAKQAREAYALADKLEGRE